MDKREALHQALLTHEFRTWQKIISLKRKSSRNCCSLFIWAQIQSLGQKKYSKSRDTVPLLKDNKRGNYKQCAQHISDYYIF